MIKALRSAGRPSGVALLLAAIATQFVDDVSPSTETMTDEAAGADKAILSVTPTEKPPD